MTFNKSLFAAFALVLLLTGCTVYQQPYPQGYVEPIYDPSLSTPVYVGGVQGYYVGGIFQPMIVVGGVSGYYNSNHVFVSNSTTVRDSVRTHKPFYSGANSATVSNTNVNTGGGNRPNYGSGGTATKGAPSTTVNNTTVNTTVNTRPNYGSGGAATKGAPSSAAPVSARPNYGGGGSSGKSGKR